VTDDSDVLRQRIRELESELGDASREIDRLRGIESENDELKAKVNLLTLSPPRVPKFSFPVGSQRPSEDAASGQPSGGAHARPGSRFGASQWSLAVILVAVVLAWIPFVLSWLDTPEHEMVRTEQRGLGAPPPRELAPAPRVLVGSDAGATPDASPSGPPAE
jgi:hypothetical protein